MKIIWTDFSEQSLDEIVDYVENKFGLLFSKKHYLDVIETVENIRINPNLFPVYQNDTETRKAVINRKTILYYKIQDQNIYLLAFYDVRKGTHKF